MIYGMVTFAALVVVSALLFRKYGGQSGSQSTTNLGEYASYLRPSQASGKFWGAVALIVVLNLIVGFFSFNLASYGFQKSPVPLFLAVNLTALLWVVGLSLGAGKWARFGMVVLSLILLQAGFGFSYGPSPGEVKAQARAAETRAEDWGGTGNINQDIVLTFDTNWSKPYIIPTGKEWWWQQEEDRPLELRDGRGRVYIDPGHQDLIGVMKDPKTGQIIESRKEEPDRTWQFRFTSGEPGRVKVYCRPYNG